MSTTAVIPNHNTLAALPVSSEVRTYAAIVTVDEKGKIVDTSLNLENTKKVAQIEAKDYSGPEVVAFKQIVSRPVIGTMDGFNELFPDDDSKLFIINKGLSVWADAKQRSILLETNSDETSLVFQPTTGKYDLTEDLKATPARKLTTEEAMIAQLRTLGASDDVIHTLFLSIKAARETPQV